MPLQKPDSCLPCNLAQLGKGFSRTDGTGSLRVMLIGESLGSHEAATGLPFRPKAPAGAVLTRGMTELGLKRDQFVFTNLAHCQPPGDQLQNPKWFYSAIDVCKQYMDAEVEQFRPKCIVALGSIPMQVLTGMSGRRVDNESISHLRGYVLKGTRYTEIPVVAAYHPAYLRRGNMALLPHLKHDLELAVAVAQSGLNAERWWAQDQVRYVADGDVRHLEALYGYLIQNPQILLTYDIETPGSDQDKEEEAGKSGERVLQIQFSVAPRTGVAVRFAKPNIEWIRKILALSNPKANQNVWVFDNPILRAGGWDADGEAWKGMRIGGRVDDTMDMWFRLQPDSPANLQYIASFYSGQRYNVMPAWKHTSSQDLKVYGCRDVDVVQRIMAKLPQELQRRGCWDSYEKWTRPFRGVLDGAQARGVPFNPVSLDQLRVEVSGQVDRVFAEVQELVPEVVKKRHPKVGYKVVPKEIKEALVGVGVVATAQQVASLGTDEAMAIRDFVTEKTGFVVREFGVKAGELTKGEIGETVNGDGMVRVKRWCKIEPFLPAGRDQVLAYIKHRGHKAPKVRGEDKETTAEDGLMRLAAKTGDEVYSKVLEYRGFLKVEGTYVSPFLEKLGKDGAVHTTYTFKSTGQTGSKNPNVQNIIKNKKVADSFRRCIEARPGHTLLRFDYKSFHAKTMALEARDLDLLRMAGLDMHSFTTAFFMREQLDKAKGAARNDEHLNFLLDVDKWKGLDDAELMSRLKWVRGHYGNVRDEKAKPAWLGCQFGQGARGLHERNLDYFKTLADAKKVLGILEQIFPATFRWQKRRRRSLIPGQAGFKGPFIITRWGFIRWFFDVAKWDFRNEKLTPGDDYNECVAFEPANDAFGLIRWNMLELDRQEWLGRARLINMVHDDLWFECPNGLVDKAVPAIWGVMERRCPMLVDEVIAPEGFSCEVEAQWGQNMGKFVSLGETREKGGLVNEGGMREIERKGMMG